MIGALYPALYAAGPAAIQIIAAAAPVVVMINVGGVWTDINRWTRIAGATITQALNETIDTASLTVSGSIPFSIAGREITFTDSAGAMFAGYVTAVRTLYEGIAANVAYACDCLDYTWSLNAIKVSQRYTTITIRDAITNVVTIFAAGFTCDFSGLTNNVVLDEITFTNEDVAQAISRTCERGGAYWYVDYTKTVRVFNSAAIPSAGTIDQNHPRQSADLAKHEEWAGVATMVRARGGGAQAAADVAPGATTIPVEDSSWYITGGLVESGPQQIYYGTVVDPGTGAVVGSGSGPTSGPTVTPATGSNLTAGATYKYAITYTTAAGETLPGGVSSYVPVGTTIGPAPAPSITEESYGGATFVIGGTYRFAWEKQISGGGRIGGTPSAPYTATAGSGGKAKYVRVSMPAGVFDNPAVIGARLFRTAAGGATLYDDAVSTATGPISYTTSSTVPEGDLIQFPPMAGGGASVLSASLTVPTSPSSSVTGRKIYRTAANGTQLKLLATLANNTATTFTDTVTDAGLGANAPTQDTSGIKPDGQVPAGSTSIIVSSTAAFPAGGGWVNVGNQTLRYTGIAGNALVLADPLPSTITYGAEITVAPYLAGIPASGSGAVVYPIAKGEDVYLYVYRYDQAAIDRLAAATGTTGMRDEFLTDGRLGLKELTARADALLAMRKDPITTVTFTTRDPAVAVGKTITFNTTSPPIAGTYLIQRVTISEMPAAGTVGTVAALRAVEASSRRFTFDDLVQQLKLLGRIN